MNKTSFSFWRGFFLIGAVLGILAFIQIIQQGKAIGINILGSKWVILLGLFALSAILSGFLSLRLDTEQVSNWLSRLEVEPSRRRMWQVVGGLSILLGIGAVYGLRFGIFRGFIPQPIPTIWLMWWLALLSAGLLKAGTGRGWTGLFALVLLMQGAVLAVVSFVPQVSSYPISIGWSEASRYYYASLVFGGRIYGQDVALSFLHPTRYFMQSIPFIVDGLPIWAHRLWQVILWLGSSAITGTLFARRLKMENRFAAMLAGTWFGLLMLYVGVYYHLQVMLWIVFAGVSVKKPWQTLAAVVLASFWAGMSRVNWFPVPAMLALALYLLEEPVRNYKNIWRYLAWPVIWTVAGLVLALASQSFYIFWSGNSNNIAAFGSSFTSDLIWSRLWPNATYPQGIVQASVIIATPMLAVVTWGIWKRSGSWHFIRLLGLGSMLLVLCAGGLVVSVKIGGGGDLHNMDAFMTMLGVISIYLLFELAVLETPLPARQPATLLVLFALAVILMEFMPVMPKTHGRDNAMAWEYIARLQDMVSQAVSEGSEVLFINQRHLLAGGVITGVPLVTEYEVVSLMEMAMSNNTEYLNRFYADLHSHRFAIIVAGSQFTQLQRDDYPFAAENNAWAEKISIPLVCEYEPILDFFGDVVLLVPRQAPACP